MKLFANSKTVRSGLDSVKSKIEKVVPYVIMSYDHKMKWKNDNTLIVNAIGLDDTSMSESELESEAYFDNKLRDAGLEDAVESMSVTKVVKKGNDAIYTIQVSYYKSVKSSNTSDSLDKLNSTCSSIFKGLFLKDKTELYSKSANIFIKETVELDELNTLNKSFKVESITPEKDMIVISVSL